MAVSQTRARSRRQIRSSTLGRIGLAAAYLFPALIIGAVGLARPNLSSAADPVPPLVQNGGFEQPVLPAVGFVTLATDSTNLAGWTVGGDGVDHIRNHWVPAGGLQSLDLGASGVTPGDGSISQTIATEPGKAYTLSFSFSANPDAPSGWPAATMDVEWGDKKFTIPTVRPPGTSNMAWQLHSEVVTGADGGGGTSLSFTQTAGGVYGVALDDVSVVPVADVQVGAPVLITVAPDGQDTDLVWRLPEKPGAYDLEFLVSDTCTDGQLGSSPDVFYETTVTIAEPGPGAPIASYFGVKVANVTVDGFAAAKIVGPAPQVSNLSECIVVGPDNNNWTDALRLNIAGGEAAVSGFVDAEGNARWFKFSISPGARVTVDLTGLPKDFDLYLFKDISKAYDTLTSKADLTRISAEFAPSAFAPSAFAPSAFAPSAFAPSAFAPSAFAPSAFAPSAFAPSAFAPSAFASAQTRSLIGISALPGTGDEWIVADTWNNTGDFYVRVSGKNGEFDTATPFTLGVSISGTECTGTIPALGTEPTAIDGDYETIVLTALGRMPDSSADKQTMLDALGGLPNAVVVDVHAYTAALHAFADTNYACPYYKNLVAGAIKDVVDDYRALNPIEHVVIVGNDDTIPFFRYPDQSLLGPEQDYVPPVGTTTTSEGSLRGNMVLGQDEYGASTTISVRGASFPVPDLAVGRLVETATEVTGMVQAYLGATGGVVPTPTSSLVTGYDFIADAADAIDVELTAGIGAQARRLVTSGDIAPQDSRSWAADDLRTAFLGQRNDIAFLGGHFSATGALAADFETEMRSSELVASTVDLTNSIVFSIGCHSGYNVVDAHGVAGATLDWAQAFAQKRATLIAGTGYQYGDTDFIEYSERLYLEFAKQLRTGSGPVAVGDALVAAKAAYLRTTPDIRGLHEKALLEASLFGLPMLSVDMPGDRLSASPEGSVVGSSLQSYTDGPGANDELDLDYFDLSTTSNLDGRTKALTNLDDPDDIITTKYFVGPDGITTNPLEPALPLDVKNVTVPGKVLRGVGFIGGTYTEETVIPLTGAPNTEIRGVHVPFSSQVFFPVRPWTVNYFDALASDAGATNLLITPVQHRSVGPGALEATARKFGSLELRLFYSDNIETFGSGPELSIPALAAAPTITGVTATVVDQEVTFRANVVGNPAAGIQEAWVTYTGHAKAFETLYLTQLGESTTWERSVTLPTSVEPTDLRFMVQAVNGVGLVTTSDDFGAGHAVRLAGVPAPTPAAASLTLNGPSTATHGSTATFTASLTSGASGVGDKTIAFSAGGISRFGTTAGDGKASVDLPLIVGTTQVSATFAGDAAIAGSTATRSITVNKAPTTMDLAGPASVGTDRVMTATLATGGEGLALRTVGFVVQRSDGQTTTTTAVTDVTGSARLTLPPGIGGQLTVDAFFGSAIAGPPAVDLTDLTFGPSQDRLTFTIQAAQVPLVITGPTAVAYGQTLGITTTGGSGTGALSFSAGSSTACSIVNGNQVRATSATGTCTLVATKAADQAYEAATSAPFAVAIHPGRTIGRDSVTMSGGSYVDSFDGGTYTGANPRNRGHVLSNGSVTISSSSVYGDIRSTGGAVTLSSSTVTGSVTAGKAITASSSTIGGTRTPNSPVAALSLQPVAACTPFTAANRISGTFTYNASNGNLTVTGGNTATLAAGAHCFNTVTLSGGARLVSAGSVVISLRGALTASGTSVINGTANAAAFQILSSGSAITLSGGGKAVAAIYASNASVVLSGGASITGVAIGKSVTMSGASSVHEDTRLYWTGSAFAGS